MEVRMVEEIGRKTGNSKHMISYSRMSNSVMKNKHVKS